MSKLKNIYLDEQAELAELSNKINLYPDTPITLDTAEKILIFRKENPDTDLFSPCCYAILVSDYRICPACGEHV